MQVLQLGPKIPISKVNTNVGIANRPKILVGKGKYNYWVL